MNRKIEQGYNILALFYDLMIVLTGKIIIRYQSELIPNLPDDGQTLILGEGTGNFIRQLARHGKVSGITSVDISPKMIQMSRFKNRRSEINVKYFIADACTFKTKNKYNIIVTNFFLDQFSSFNTNRIIEKYSLNLNTDGRWLITDFFKTSNPVYSLMHKILFLFFRMVCKIEANQLPDYHRIFLDNGFQILYEKKYILGIKSIIYHKI